MRVPDNVFVGFNQITHFFLLVTSGIDWKRNILLASCWCCAKDPRHCLEVSGSVGIKVSR